MFDDSIKILTKPREAFAGFKAKANNRDAVLLIAWFYAVLGLVIGVFLSFKPFGLNESYIPGLLLLLVFVPTAITKAIGLIAVIAIPIYLVTVFLLLYAFSSFVEKTLSNLLGGKASFTKLFYASAKANLVFTAIKLIAYGFSYFSLVGIVIQVGLGLYVFYLTVVLISETTKLNLGKSVVVSIFENVFFTILATFV